VLLDRSGMTTVFLREPPRTDYLWAALCVLAAAYFIFRSGRWVTRWTRVESGASCDALRGHVFVALYLPFGLTPPRAMRVWFEDSRISAPCSVRATRAAAGFAARVRGVCIGRSAVGHRASRIG
jgi:hypothetical protein